MPPENTKRRFLRYVSLPKKGEAYELYDLAFVAWALVLGSYFLAEPSPSTENALSWLLGTTPLMFWGYVLNAAALGALVCSYVPGAIGVGRILIFITAGPWAAIVLLGWLGEATWEITGWEWSAFGIAVAFASVVYAGAAWWYQGEDDVPWDVSVGRGVCIVGTVAVFMFLAAWVGDPRQLAAAVVYGFLARTAFHQTLTLGRSPR